MGKTRPKLRGPAYHRHTPTPLADESDEWQVFISSGAVETASVKRMSCSAFGLCIWHSSVAPSVKSQVDELPGKRASYCLQFSQQVYEHKFGYRDAKISISRYVKFFVLLLNGIC